METMHNNEQKDELLPSAHHHAKPMLVEVDSCPTMKGCSKCKKTKCLSFFKKCKRSKYGVKSQCKFCDYEYHKDYCSKHRKRMSEYTLKSLRKSNYKSVKEYHLRNPLIRIKMNKKSAENLDNRYMRSNLINNSFPIELINNIEIIEVKRLIIKTKRLCKTSQN